MKKWIHLDERGQFYIEVVLVYFDVPLLFVCRDEEARKYLVECVDEEKDVYLISPISNVWLLKLLKKEKTMEECLKQNKQHEIIRVWYSVGTGAFEEWVCKSSELNDDEFPDQGEYLEYHSEEVEKYQKELEKELEKDAVTRKVINTVTLKKGISKGGILINQFNKAKPSRPPIRQRQEYNTQDLKKRRGIWKI